MALALRFENRNRICGHLFVEGPNFTRTPICDKPLANASRISTEPKRRGLRKCACARCERATHEMQTGTEALLPIGKQIVTAPSFVRRALSNFELKNAIARSSVTPCASPLWASVTGADVHVFGEAGLVEGCGKEQGSGSRAAFGAREEGSFFLDNGCEVRSHGFVACQALFRRFCPTWIRRSHSVGRRNCRHERDEPCRKNRVHGWPAYHGISQAF